jgi:hypothetical protein
MALTPTDFATLRAQTEVSRCDHCDKVIVGRKIMHQDVYMPFEDEPSTFTYCEPCCDRGYDQGSEHFYCDWCRREVWENRGYRLNYKVIADCMLQCVRCFQERMLEHGHSDDEIEGDRIPCDFYDYTELAAHGWREGESFSGSWLERTKGEPWREYCRLAKLAGALVLTDQGRTSIIGGPDYVTVWIKDTSYAEA